MTPGGKRPFPAASPGVSYALFYTTMREDHAQVVAHRAWPAPRQFRGRRAATGAEATLMAGARGSLSLSDCRAADGFPIGFQIAGRHMEEAVALRAGHAFQEAIEWHKRRPPFT
jgi:Asp-tRNA(Asn)/Glu-tRNA(Gln) amidotransferase A subunit family amidase